MGVSWFEAQAYAAWLTTDSRPPHAPGLVWRLPTEAEWEKAARGGLRLAGGAPNPAPDRLFPWKGDFDSYRAHCIIERSEPNMAPVGCYPGGHSPYGAWDMAGNVWEWCLDWFRRDA